MFKFELFLDCLYDVIRFIMFLICLYVVAFKMRTELNCMKRANKVNHVNRCMCECMCVNACLCMCICVSHEDTVKEPVQKKESFTTKSP